MDLHNGELFWGANDDFKRNIQEQKMEKHYDVVIIGGGMSGSLCAYTLANEGLKVAVIDKGEMGGGSTRANTGLLQFSNDIMLHDLIEQIGEQKAVRFYKLCEDAVDKLEDVSKNLPFSSEFIRRKSLYFASDSSDVERLKKEYDALSKNGFKTQYLSKDKIQSLFPFQKEAAIITEGDAEVNPYKFSTGIIEYLNQKGVHIFEKVNGLKITEKDSGVEIHTSAGNCCTTHIVFATGYDTPPFLAKPGSDLNRSYAIATEPIKDFSMWHDQVLIWETKRPYLYLRTTCDGRIIAGGLDEDQPETPQSEDWIQNRGERLKQEVANLFPMLDVKVAYAWGALFGESIDNLPFIGKHPSKERMYYLLGYGGNGTVYSMLGSIIIKDLILGVPNKDAEIVSLNRIS